MIFFVERDRRATWGMAAQSRTLPAAKKAPGPLVGTLESRH